MMFEIEAPALITPEFFVKKIPIEISLWNLFPRFWYVKP